MELFRSIFGRSISPYSARIRENTDQNNSEYRNFSRSASFYTTINKTSSKKSIIINLKSKFFSKNLLSSVCYDIANTSCIITSNIFPLHFVNVASNVISFPFLVNNYGRYNTRAGIHGNSSIVSLLS